MCYGEKKKKIGFLIITRNYRQLTPSDGEAICLQCDRNANFVSPPNQINEKSLYEIFNDFRIVPASSHSYRPPNFSSNDDALQILNSRSTSKLTQRHTTIIIIIIIIIIKEVERRMKMKKKKGEKKVDGSRSSGGWLAPAGPDIYPPPPFGSVRPDLYPPPFFII